MVEYTKIHAKLSNLRLNKLENKYRKFRYFVERSY